uniref:Uncharacterized protein n=1 Tax=Anguilla anguilla TaxID=7936 RepID=A0A0E9RT15_ANGAN
MASLAVSFMGNYVSFRNPCSTVCSYFNICCYFKVTEFSTLSAS